jgi:hypothetical protein
VQAEAPAGFAGKRVKCPKCGILLEVPVPKGVLTDSPPPVGAAPETSSPWWAGDDTKPPTVPPAISQQPPSNPVGFGSPDAGAAEADILEGVKGNGDGPPKVNLLRRAIWTILGVLVGCLVGFFAAHHFAFFGGMALHGTPYSPARYALVPGHMLLCGILLGLAGFGIGWTIDQRKYRFGYIAGNRGSVTPQLPPNPPAGLGRSYEPGQRRWKAHLLGYRGVLAGVAVLLVLACVAVGALFLFTGNGPLAGPPSTCREVAERLQARGMDIRWTSKTSRYPAIFIVKKGSPADGMLGILDDPKVYPYVGDWAQVVQFPTPQEAREEAGTMKHAFSWGRFLIYGDGELVTEIKSRL